MCSLMILMKCFNSNGLLIQHSAPNLKISRGIPRSVIPDKMMTGISTVCAFDLSFPRIVFPYAAGIL